MKYTDVKEGVFLQRPNRFIAYVSIDGAEEICHVKNTGRCGELLVPQAKVYVQESLKQHRKTKYDLIAVEKQEPDGTCRTINMDSQVPNQVVREWIQKGNFLSNITLCKPEVKCGESRLDFYLERADKHTERIEKIFLEVKGVTLENDGVVSFPDAKSERAVRHVKELMRLKEAGYEAYVMFVIQMRNVKFFEPNDIRHKEFGQILRQAEKAGVHLLAYACDVTPDSIDISDKVDIKLSL